MPIENILIKIRKQCYAEEHSVLYLFVFYINIQKSNIANEVLRYKNIKRYSLLRIL